MSAKKNILITGASGFIGGFLVTEALLRKFSVFVLVRKSTNTQQLKKQEVNIVEVDFSNIDELAKKLALLPELHYVIHNAGLTRAVTEKDFFDVNEKNTENLIEALDLSGKLLTKFLFVSSLAAAGPSNSDDPVTVNSDPNPITAYGRSKLAAEKYITEKTNMPYVIFRPTAVYGPGDKDFFQTVKMIEKGIDLEIGRSDQRFTFIYVKDFARLVFEAMESEFVNCTYMASDGRVYRKEDFGQIAAKHLGNSVKAIKVPVSIAKVVAAIAEFIGKLSGKPSILRVDKIAEMAAYSWDCDIRPMSAQLNYIPKYNLDNGMRETIGWYKHAGWLK